MIYLDTSAAMKALVLEEGSEPVRRLFAGSEPLVSSRLLAVELHAAAHRRGLSVAGAEELLERVSLVSLDDGILDDAVALRTGLRSLDALHLATALLLGKAVTSFLAFDDELNGAARRNGLTLHPASARS